MAERYFEVTDVDKILEYFDDKSHSVSEYIKEHMNSEYLLIYKYMTHSDLPNRGKRNGSKETIDKDYLYYLSIPQMKKLEETQDKPFESAKQSNIGVPTNFFSSIGMEQLQRREGAQSTQHEHLKVNDYADVYLVNDMMKYFSADYTRKVLDKLDKKPTWYNEDFDVNLLDSSEFTPIQISHAIHGIGTSQDSEFAKLRLNVFKNDILIILIESTPKFDKNVFVMFERNPIFFTLIGESNLSWQKYAEKQKKIEEAKLSSKEIVESEEEKTRKQQSKWRDLLAQEMMNYSTSEGEVFCPFTFLTCNYNDLGTLFRASHIKAYSECDNAQEAFDVNNGLLLCANADALFDKHLITVGEDKELIFSYTLKGNPKLINNLLLSQPIFKLVLNDKRMEYMSIHREQFYAEEAKRKTRV